MFKNLINDNKNTEHATFDLFDYKKEKIYNPNVKVRSTLKINNKDIINEINKSSAYNTRNFNATNSKIYKLSRELSGHIATIDRKMNLLNQNIVTGNINIGNSKRLTVNGIFKTKHAD